MFQNSRYIEMDQRTNITLCYKIGKKRRRNACSVGPRTDAVLEKCERIERKPWMANQVDAQQFWQETISVGQTDVLKQSPAGFMMYFEGV